MTANIRQPQFDKRAGKRSAPSAKSARTLQRQEQKPIRTRQDNGKPTITLNWCSREAAKFAVEHWHYSGKLPCGKLVTVGAWEDDRFIGAVVFGRGATPQVAKHFKVKQTQMAELVRVALRDHIAPTSKVVAIALRMLRRQSPGLGFVVSFADDTNQGHVGTIYQAGNWIYLGESKARWLNIDGEERHPRLQLRGFRRKNPNARVTYTEDKIKHRYVFPLTDEFRQQFAGQARPYPKRDV